MKKYICIILCLLLSLSLCACSNNVDEPIEEVSSEQPVNVYDAIVECVKENGEKDDGSGDYRLVQSTRTGNVTVCYRSEGYLSLYSSIYSGSSFENSEYVEQVRMDVYTISDKYILSYTIMNKDYTMSYNGKAEIYPSDVSTSYLNIQILEDSMRPSSSTLLSSSRDLFKMRVREFLDDTNTLLKQYTDYGVVDLGFINWR